MTDFAGIPVSAPGSIRPDYGRWLIHGPQGSGKTTLASTIAGFGPTLFIDLIGEHGLRSFQGAAYEGNISVLRPESVRQMDDIYYALAAGGHPYKAVVVDSITSLQKMALRYLRGHSETAVREIEQGGKPASMQTWGQSLDIMTDHMTFWYGLASGNRPQPMHVVMTAQTKVITDDENGDTRRQPDVQAGALSIVKSTPDYILYTDVIENEGGGDEGQPALLHIARFGDDPDFSMKARIPVGMWGKIPPVLGRKNPPDLVALSRTLGVGGAPRQTPKRAAQQSSNPTNKETTDV